MRDELNRARGGFACGLLALLLAACATPRFDVARPVSHALADASHTPLAQVFAAESRAHPGLSGFQLLASGHAAFVSRAALADMAVQTLDLQYYSVGEDLTTDLLLERIAAAAARGVRVRLLLDDVHPFARAFAKRAMALHANIEVRLFNPFLSVSSSMFVRLGEFAVDGERLNRRMHNKLWAADNAVAIFGSRNLGDEYFDTSATDSFVDIDLLAAGPVVQQMSRAFDDYWNSRASWPAEAFGVPSDEEAREAHASLRHRTQGCHAVPPCHWLAENGMGIALRSGQVALSWPAASLSYDPPDGAKLPVPSGIAHAPHADPPGEPPARELLVVSPYLVPDEEGLDHLAAMRTAGHRIAVLTNSLAATDSVAAHAGYARHRKHLLAQGVELHETRPASGRRHRTLHRWGRASPGSLHAKFIVQDRRWVVLGSRNQDPRSRLHNTESWVTVESRELADELAALFDEATELHHAYQLELQDDETGPRLAWKTEEDGVLVTHGAEPQAGFWRHVWRSILAVMLPEHML